ARRPAAQHAPLPGPPLRRGAAARLDRARRPQPPAAARVRRADGQSGPRHFRRHHAAPLSHQPQRHDDPDGHARPRDGRQDAPPRHRARGRAARPRRAARGLRVRMRFRTLVAEAWRSLAANASTTIAATMTVLIAMFILGLSIGLGTWALSWSNHVKKELVVHVYFCTQLSCGKDATRAQEERVRNMIGPAHIPQVKSVSFVSKAQALRLMAKKNPELMSSLPGNPLPDAFEITPKHGEDVELIASKVPNGHAVGVERVNYGKKTAKRILRVARV